MENWIRNIFITLLVALTLVSCRRNKVDGIIISNDFFMHQSYSENRELRKLIIQTLGRDEKSLAKLNNFWCGGAAGCYDLGFIITQIIYRLGEQEFIQMVNRLDDKDIIGLRGLIWAGLEYGDNDGDGKMDDKRIEDEFPDLNTLLETKAKNYNATH